jgi:hypothetical protein
VQTLVSILATEFLYADYWHCVSLLSSPCRHRWKCCKNILFHKMSMGIRAYIDISLLLPFVNFELIGRTSVIQVLQ